MLYRTLTLEFFLVCFDVILLIMLLCFLFTAAILTSTSITTQNTWAVNNAEQAEAIAWSPELNMHADPTDSTHKAIVEAVAGLLDLIQDCIAQQKTK
jgi:hypothetical protein